MIHRKSHRGGIGAFNGFIRRLNDGNARLPSDRAKA